MAKSPELIVKVGANTKDFDKELKNLPKTADKSMKALKIGAAGAAIAFAALAVGAADSVKVFAEFERTFSNVVTLLDEGSFKTKSLTDGINGLEQGITDLRASSGQSFGQLNKGLFDLVSAGVDAEGAITALTVATDLALAGATDTGIAVSGMTSAMNAFGFEADEARAISEKFFTAQKFGKTTIAELSTDLGKVAATASEMGISFDEVLASVSAVTLAGIETNEAYTGLKAVLSNIIKPSKAAADEAERLGINFDSSALRARGFQGFLESITESAKFNSSSLETLFGSMEAANVAFALAGSQAQSFRNILKELGDEQKRSATLTDAINTKNETTDQKFKKLKGSADALQKEIGERLSPAFGEFADNAADSLDAIRLNLDDLTLSLDGFHNALSGYALGLAQVISDVAGSDIQFQEPFSRVDPAAALADIKAQNDAELIAFEELQASKFNALQDTADKEAGLEQEKKDRAIAHQEDLDQIAAEKAEKEAEAEALRLELEAERFEADIERLEEHLSNKDETEARFSGLKELREAKELKTRAKTDKEKEKSNEVFAKAEDKLGKASLGASLDRLQMLVGEESAAGKAIFLIKQAQALSSAIVHTSEAVTEALPNVPLAAAVGIAGGLEIATIAATGFKGVSGAVDGGIVQGGTFGRDTEPFMLARDEVIVPSRLNPLSTDFEGEFGDSGLGGGQNVQVEISLTDDAARFITAGQREDSALGV